MGRYDNLTFVTINQIVSQIYKDIFFYYITKVDKSNLMRMKLALENGTSTPRCCGVVSDNVQICPLNYSGNVSFLRFLVDHSPQHKRGLDFTPKHRRRILQNTPVLAVTDFWRLLLNDQLLGPDHCFLELPVKWCQTSLSTLLFSFVSIIRVFPIQK